MVIVHSKTAVQKLVVGLEVVSNKITSVLL